MALYSSRKIAVHVCQKDLPRKRLILVRKEDISSYSPMKRYTISNVQKRLRFKNVKMGDIINSFYHTQFIFVHASWRVYNCETGRDPPSIVWIHLRWIHLSVLTHVFLREFFQKRNISTAIQYRYNNVLKVGEAIYICLGQSERYVPTIVMIGPVKTFTE